MDRTLTLPWRPAAARDPNGWQANSSCIFFAQGKCRNGQACSFSHATVSEPTQERPLPSAVEATNRASEPSEGDSRKNVTCRFYSLGACLKGDLCPFSHDSGVEAGEKGDALVHDSAKQADPDDSRDDWVREIGGVVVQYGDGAAVLKASLPSDFSAVRVRMLPPNSTQASVCNDFLRDLGFDVPMDAIRVTPIQNHCDADIRLEDASFAKRLAEAVDPKAVIKVEVVNAPMPKGSNFQRVECRKVNCSWHRPLKMVWLNFRDKRDASAAENGFSSGAYKILDTIVKSHGVKGSVKGPRTSWNPQLWTVVLTEVPVGATKTDVDRPLHPLKRPSHIELGKASFQYDMATANALVKSKLMEIGPLDWWEDAAEKGGKRAKARGRFQEEGVAAKAAAALNGWALPFGNKLRLDAHAIYSARFRVAERIFKVVKPVIDAQTPSWRAKHVFLTAYDASKTNAHRVLRLEGEQKEAVAEVKGALEKIIAGIVVMNADASDALWTPAFAFNGGAFLKLKHIEESLGVAVVRNKRRSCLHLFGSPENCKAAQPLLAAIVNEDKSTTHSIDLTDDQFTWARLGGFADMKKTFGRKISFNSISTPKRILITGSEEDHRLALDKLTTREPPTVTATNAPEDDTTCSICWTDAEDPIQTSCAHTYCTDCFEHFCFSGSTSNTDFTLRCAGASSTCLTPLPLPEIQDHLSSRALEKILHESFTSYIRRRPSTFRYCATPDCETVYRASPTTSPVAFTCPKCLTTTCTACHDAHEGMTCAEHLDHKSGGYAALQKTKAELGIKDCPKCKTSIEKTEGCNHMTCLGCGTHICWKCMGTFKTGDACYAHLTRAHGGAFDAGYGGF
ncbi:hypothetical protein QBC34DRAFT_397735 [Podospora aff. communis PSN243]|uniref:Uncharacterized protein n=1 Tax=Podospora aff. communis PSN243 TaxID=3040156 RepID=A0AAV9GXS5_9PEZI|nr:hypothetical protein QBC34DRAFT_397735 [Podospora aff. communis PSN243]